MKRSLFQSIALAVIFAAGAKSQCGLGPARPTALGSPRALAADATFTTIDVPGATTTIPIDTNSAGDIVGRYVSAADLNTHGFLLSKGVFTTIDFPASNFTVTAGIDRCGDIVGMYRLLSDPSTARHGFLLSEGEFTTIDPPGSVFTNALGINPRGDIVGRFCTTTPCASDGGNVHGFLRTPSGDFTTIDFPDAIGTNAWKIDSQGQILGGSTGADGSSHIFLLKPDGFTTIDPPGGLALFRDNGGINPSGALVGIYCDTAPCTNASKDDHGFLFSAGEFTPINYPDAPESGAFSINARGDIVGYYVDASGIIHGFLLSRAGTAPAASH